MERLGANPTNVMNLRDKIAAHAKFRLAWWILLTRARRHGIDGGELRRIQHYLLVSSRLRKPRYAQPAQRPEHYFAGLTAKPWYEAVEFPWTESLGDAYDTIERELRGVYSHLQIQPGKATDSGRWDVYYFYYLGGKVEQNCRRCPETTRIIDSLPEFNGTGHVYFSVLAPGSHITRHCGPINAWLRCHFGVVVPDGCRIRVGPETRSWEKGRSLIFDDSFEHEAWNTSAETRTVLVLDFWHPELTDAEAWAMRQIIRISAIKRNIRDLV